MEWEYASQHFHRLFLSIVSLYRFVQEFRVSCRVAKHEDIYGFIGISFASICFMATSINSYKFQTSYCGIAYRSRGCSPLHCHFVFKYIRFGVQRLHHSCMGFGCEGLPSEVYVIRVRIHFRVCCLSLFVCSFILQRQWPRARI